MRVELDIFSGRPNPVWSLDAQAAAALASRLRSLVRGTADAADDSALPGLGYRGFLYGAGIESGRAYRGSIWVDGTAFDDPARTVERLLLCQLPTEWAEIRPIVERAMFAGI